MYREHDTKLVLQKDGHVGVSRGAIGTPAQIEQSKVDDKCCGTQRSSGLYLLYQFLIHYCYIVFL